MVAKNRSNKHYQKSESNYEKLITMLFISVISGAVLILFDLYFGTLTDLLGTALMSFILIALFVCFLFSMAVAFNLTLGFDAENVECIGVVDLVLFAVLAVFSFVLLVSSHYPYSLQVFYPNHPSMTISQNCTAIVASSSGYINGQPINQTNTTKCILPSSMSPYRSNPFNCDIKGENITCVGTGYENVTWIGKVLSVSKR